MEKHEAEKNLKADFCFCASAMASHADAEAFRTMVDWLNWIFYFDEGQLDRDPVAAEKEIRHTFAVLEDGAETPDREQYPMRYLFRTIWDRCLCIQRASPDVQTQFKITHKRYLDGLLHQVEATRDGDGQPRTEEDYIRMRRRNVGGYPCISLIAHNDIVSYKKDVKSGIEHNIVTVLKKNGFTTQQAMDRAGELQDECYRRWYLALTSMPVWGEATDREVLRYIEACHSFPLGDLLWSFQTGRDLGATEGYKLHETKVLNLSDLEPIAA
ncbi:isoprenoid synthase domain-containing protein [Fusarium oxysporum II5]|uniref:Terpene synthase n=1 Tax=Fusarium odoratissimum (strain NRRL 54006) TaxID=1089451 RepID=X0K464_FUSO5|nr:uncharacterized protein FOIG_06229 [Fusarium odoratissimum NRRL 54006]EXM03421.1 hypothetical protein FOIG_06229 [Fusarium odoratissimum NRRL 54006]KAK2134671.1 isoprenoid synthase domain-containing protein [Fusarium oxysporum II5]